ncbi:MAG: tetratricopeptide repeat protein [Pseudomonadota bacterium]
MNEHAFPELEAAAQAGDVDAQCELGHVFREGRHDRAVDLEEALRWYDRAARQGHQAAAFNVGLLALRGLPQSGIAPRPDLAMPALEFAANHGDEKATCLLGEALITGEGGVPRDPNRGRRLLEVSAEAGSALAMNCLGGHLMDGGLPQNPAAANGWFKRAAQLEDPPGLFNLGVSLLEGRGLDVNAELARKLFAHAARKHHPPAMYALAVMMVEGRGGPAKPQAGSRLLLEAARAGDASAQFQMGEVLREGLGGAERDPVGAVNYYRLAAERGHPDALYALGVCLEQGIGAVADVAAASGCYRRATAAGHPGAAHNLGVMAARGEGIARDPVMAEALFEFAVASGHVGALTSLAALQASIGRLEDACATAHVSAQRQPEGQGAALAAQLEDRLDEAARQRARERAAVWEPPASPHLPAGIAARH